MDTLILKRLASIKAVSNLMIFLIIIFISANSVLSQGGQNVQKSRDSRDYEKKPQTPSVTDKAPEDISSSSVKASAKSPYRVIRAFLTDDSSSYKAGLSDKITIVVDSLSLLLEEAKVWNNRIIPFIEGKPLNGVYSIVPDGLIFILERADSSRMSWEKLLRKPSFFTGSKEVSISVGIENHSPIPSEVNNFSLSIYKPESLWMWFAIVFLLAIFLLYYLGYKKGMLRDPSQATDNKNDVPYSLALTQMAFWYCLVVSAYLLLFLITKEIPKITGTVLTLIGISSLTAWGSTAINTKKNNEPKKQKQKLQAEQKTLTERIDDLLAQISKNPPNEREIRNDIDNKKSRLNEITDELSKYPKPQKSSKSNKRFFKDLVSDATGYSLYRIQIVIWTLILGGSFLFQVWEKVEMPEFPETLLVLMGISSGTYLLFKLPEERT